MGSPLLCEVCALSAEILHREQSYAATKQFAGVLGIIIFPKMNSDDKYSVQHFCLTLI